MEHSGVRSLLRHCGRGGRPHALLRWHPGRGRRRGRVLVRPILALALAVSLCGCGARSSLAVAGTDTDSSSSSGSGAGATHPAGRTLSVSWQHSCAITSDGEVACWGLGGSTFQSPTPKLIAGLDHVVEIATGQVLDCARRADGKVLCWGEDNGGEPAEILGATFSSIVVGGGVACGVVAGSSGGVACAGASFLTGSSCSNDVTTWSPLAVPVPSLTGVAGIAGGEWHACAFEESGSTWCWGCGFAPGPLGLFALGSMSASTATPIAVPSVASTKAIAGETESTCAAQADGSTVCWGDRSQFGPGIQFQPTGPTAAEFPAFPIDLDVGVTFSCAAVANEIHCVGGIPTFADGCKDRVDTPLAVSLPGVREISVGYQHACARDADGAVWCWGCNTAGEVGDGTTTARAAPIRVL